VLVLGGKPCKFGVREANGGAADFGCTVHPDVGRERDRGLVAFAVPLGSSAVLTPTSQTLTYCNISLLSEGIASGTHHFQTKWLRNGYQFV
jgi:hypothetical protein